MTVLVTIPQQTYSDEEATRIFNEIVHGLQGTAATHLSSFEDEDYKVDDNGRGLVMMGEFELPEPVDYTTYDTMKQRYEEQYSDVAITIEATDTYPIHNFDDVNVEGPIET